MMGFWLAYADLKPVEENSKPTAANVTTVATNR
jgi:hypothetical protein